ncbi:tetraspanin-9 isoform X3 [Amphiprion ocellaris]|uniref:tetraspanin-9 isoform X3 n=1 Tax=Amphiprion ocellaris TaxID=80972 RepID=UPI0024116497|nr:tetraspanin-9 isoform X3 [Amphiprion ocellaris]
MSASQTCLCCVKYLMFVFNLIFWLGGCGLFGVGVWLSFTQAEFSSLPLSFPSLSAANLLLVAGGITMVTGFLGCLGALKEQRCLLFMFFAILLLLVLTEVTLVLVIHIFHDKLDSKAQDELKEGMKIYESEPGLKKSWDNVQKMFKCCGVSNKTDWFDVLNGTLPSSCCSVGTQRCEDGWSEIQDQCEGSLTIWCSSAAVLPEGQAVAAGQHPVSAGVWSLHRSRSDPGPGLLHGDVLPDSLH